MADTVGAPSDKNRPAFRRSLARTRIAPPTSHPHRPAHFDRFVHLAYGLCFGPVIVAVLRGRWAPLIAVEVVLSTSALYELFEWGIALTLAPGDAEAYNGQQGDMWDAHKDMALATAGALVGVLVTWWW
jgi:putative membrane protein